MSTEPYLNGKIIWASLKGAVASTGIILCLLIASLFLPSTPDDDGHVRSAAVLIGFLPIILGVFFIYFLVLSAKKNRPFKFALIVQSVLLLPVSLLVSYSLYSSVGLELAALFFLYTFGLMSLVFGIGAWAWSQPKST